MPPFRVALPRPAGTLPPIFAVLGTITAQELIRAAAASPHRPVLDLARSVELVGPGEPRSTALARLDEAGVGSMLALRDGRLAGTVHYQDLPARSAAGSALCDRYAR